MSQLISPRELVARLTAMADTNEVGLKGNLSPTQSELKSRLADSTMWLREAAEQISELSKGPKHDGWKALAKYGFVHDPTMMTIGEAITSEIDSYRTEIDRLRAEVRLLQGAASE